jgi:glycerol-3-phosphate dehydrogenase (NAD(P)+)
MTSQNTSNLPVGVIGAGSFGTVIANLLAENQAVYWHMRREEVAQAIIETRQHLGQDIHPNIHPTTSLEAIAEQCKLIFPVVPSKNFRAMMQALGPFLRPEHVLIHGTKGLDIIASEADRSKVTELKLPRERVKSMSQVIREESSVVRVGCISGPNLAKEIAQKLPAATVVASHFDEVIEYAKAALRSSRFMVFENDDLEGVEIAGVLKNILALGSGMVSGLGLGENARALMITRGWRELMQIGELFGSDRNAFMGLAGIGDMIATCTSPLSRNYSVGFRLAKGEKLEDIIASMDETAEGVNTVRTAMALVRYYDLHSPLIKSFHAVLFEGLDIQEAIKRLIAHRHGPDVDFM